MSVYPIVPIVEPVYIVVVPDAAPGHPEAPDSGLALMTGDTETCRPFVPVFTDEDLAERWIRQTGHPSAVPRCLPTRQDFAAFLKRAQDDGHQSVGYDPIVGWFLVVPIQRVRDELRRLGDSGRD